MKTTKKAGKKATKKLVLPKVTDRHMNALIAAATIFYANK